MTDHASLLRQIRADARGDKETAFDLICRAALPVMREWAETARKLNLMFMEAWRAGVLDDLWRLIEEQHPDMWLLYFIRARGMGDIKIGKTKHITTRVKSLFSNCSRGIDLIACYPISIEQETEAHRDFERYRLCGEWFQPGDDILTHLHLIGVDPSKFSNVVPAHHFRRYPEKLQ